MDNEVKVNVPLQWSDFLWSLEQLRHSPYSKGTAQKDWFRLNPLEVVLLACDALGQGSAVAKPLQAQLVLGLDDISAQAIAHPRLWLRLLKVLCVTAVHEDNPTLIVQKTVVALCQLYEATNKHLNRLSLVTKTVFAVDFFDGLKQIVDDTGITIGPARERLAQVLLEVEDLRRSSHDHLGMLLQPLIRATEDVDSLWPIACKMLLLSNGADRYNTTTEDLLQFLVNELHLSEKMAVLLRAGRDSTMACCRLFDIIEVFLVSREELQNELNRSTASSEKSSNQPTETDAVNVNISEGGGEDESNTEERTAPTSQPSPSANQRFAALLDRIFAAMEKWHKEVEAGPSLVAEKLLELAFVLFSVKPLGSSLPLTVNFFDKPLQLLMTYSSEGYLSSQPTSFLIHLLEFVSTAVENDMTVETSLNTLLPNIFGPVFGVHHARVSELVLEFASLSLYSRHRKELLLTGLPSIVSVFRLIPSIHQIRAQQNTEADRLQAISAAHSAMMDVLERVDRELLLRATQEEEEGREEEEENDEEERGNGEAQLAPHRRRLYWQPSVLSLPLTDSFSWPPNVLLLNDSESEELFREDRTLRLDILISMLELACAVVRTGESSCYLFLSVLPRLAKEVPPESNLTRQRKLARFFGAEPPAHDGYILWPGDRRGFLLHLLRLGAAFVGKTHRTPFHLFAVVVPKLAANLNHVNLKGQERWDAVIDILNVAMETLQSGHDIEELVTHGFDLLSCLLPASANRKEIERFAQQMGEHFVTASHTSLLLLARIACNFMLETFPDDREQIQALFRALVLKGRRSDIRCVFRMCTAPFAEERFAWLRPFLYSYASAGMNSRQLQALSDIFCAIVDICRVARVAEDLDELSEELAAQQVSRERCRERLVSLTKTPLNDLVKLLKASEFKRPAWEKIQQQLSAVMLYKTLFSEELEGIADSPVSDFTADTLLSDRFPAEVLADRKVMSFMEMCAARIQHMQIPRFVSLKTLLVTVLRQFLTPSPAVKEASQEGDGEAVVTHMALSEFESLAVKLRARAVLEVVEQLPQNQVDRQRLLACGYSPRLWQENFSVTVKTDGTRSLEENLRQTLLACYTEYSELLKQLGVTHVEVDGEQVKCSELFDELLSLNDLRGRRAIAVRAIDKHLSKILHASVFDRKLALLANEDRIESEFEAQASAPISPKTFVIKLNTSFFDCARCCGPQIIGCYAPTGEHSQRPLEIGLRVDSAMVTIVDEAGVEIENAELLFADEAVYVYKAYTNGHPYNTAQVWLKFLEGILKEPALVPAVVIPQGFPNQQTWNMLRRTVSTVLTGSLLTCHFDFSPEWRTYYDSRPERIRCGVDILLHPNFEAGRSSDQEPRLQRQTSILSKDLGAMVFESLMQILVADSQLRQFRFLGKVLAQCTSHVLETGKECSHLLESQFDYQRWAKAQRRNPAHLPSKEDIVSRLSQLVHAHTLSWCVDADVNVIFGNSRRLFFDLKAFLEHKKTHGAAIKKQLTAIAHRLEKSTFIVSIDALPEAVQEELMRWIFYNEDRVWRYRGGRDRHETLDQYLNFLSHRRAAAGNTSGKPTPFPGVLAMAVHCEVSVWSVDQFSFSDIAAYAVGEYESVDNSIVYEVVTAWVQPRFRGLNLSIRMYADIMTKIKCSRMLCDMVEGSLERIIARSAAFSFLERIGLLGHIICKRETSYEVTEQTGRTERFEQLVIDRWLILAALNCQQGWQLVRSHPIMSSLSLLSFLALGGFVLLRNRTIS